MRGVNPRKPIQKQHERVLINGFLAFINTKNGTRFVVDSEPEPPEAIAKDGDNYIWLEVTDAFFSAEYARDLYSYATLGETHIPAPGGTLTNPDDQFATGFIQCVRKKLSKPSYKKVFDTHGKGVLIVGIQYPLFDENVVRLIQQHQKAGGWESDLGYFDKIYISHNTAFYEYEWWRS